MKARKYPLVGLATGMLLLATSALAQTVTNTYPIPSIPCTSTNEFCTNTFDRTVQTTGLLKVRYTAPATHCSDIRIHVFLDGQENAATERLKPGDASNWLDLGAVSSGAHLVQCEAEGFVGGCNAGTFSSWAGQLEIITGSNPMGQSQPVAHSLWLFVIILIVIIVVCFCWFIFFKRPHAHHH